MRFDEGRSIYQQIVEYVQDQILRMEWVEEVRLPAVRELAVDLGVNPNTVQRSYSALQDQGLIYNRRGVGYFVAEGAQEKTRNRRREQFVSEVLPRVFEIMDIIGFTDEDFRNVRKRWTEERKEKT